MKARVIGSQYDGLRKFKFKSYLKATSSIDIQRRFCKHRYWIEVNKHGQHRLCKQSFDDYQDRWCKERKGKYFTFVALSYSNSEVYAIYVHDNLHPSYIDGFIREYDFDSVQLERLTAIKERLEISWRSA